MTLTNAHIVERLLARNIFTKAESAQVLTGSLRTSGKSGKQVKMS
jgi:hypothetical protein